MASNISFENPTYHLEEIIEVEKPWNESCEMAREGLGSDPSHQIDLEESDVHKEISRSPCIIIPPEVNHNEIKGSKGTYVVSHPTDHDKSQDYSLHSIFKDFYLIRSLETISPAICKNIKISKYWRKIVWSILLCSFVFYFMAVILISSSLQEKGYWCEGSGFFIVISSTVFIFLFYFKIFKPCIGMKINKCLSHGLNESIVFNKLQFITDLWYVKMIVYILIIFISIILLVIDSQTDRSRLTSLLGIFIFIILGFLFSTAPRKVIWRQVLWGLGLQFVFGLIILRWSVGKSIFSCLGSRVNRFLTFSFKGSEFVYGELVSELHVFAFRFLTVIFYFGFCIQILYYYGAMQWIVINLGWILQTIIGTTACESVTAAANIFLGMATAPLLIKPYLPKMTKSELHSVMTGGFATIAGAGLAAYASFGVDAAHLLSASVMSAPAALGYAKLVYPEVEVSKTNAKDIQIDKGAEKNALHAGCEGIASSLSLVASIIANLIAFIAFLAFTDAIMNWICLLVNIENGVCNISNIFGYVFMPLAWIMGVPWQDCYYVGRLIGIKTIINEFVGYIQLAEYIKTRAILRRSEIIATYALCGFSNIASIGIQIGAMGALAPERRGDLAEVAFRAMIAGSVACFLTACVAGCLITSDEDMTAIYSNFTNVN